MRNSSLHRNLIVTFRLDKKLEPLRPSSHRGLLTRRLTALQAASEGFDSPYLHS